ncbi:MAG TPA: ATP-binding cassette domain-containing protein [Caulobacteraceae bacterium]|nr:ATP-binding cassette domain-containing protein [Caulobacteraceae bacterium]
MSTSILVLDEVTKRFGDFVAVDRLSFAVPEGGVFGFLGGNGAGKTTSLRMALDIIRPTSGRIEVLGGPPARHNAVEIGFLPEERGLYRLMTVVDTIVYFGRLKRMGQTTARKAAQALIERLGLSDKADTPVGKLSKGLAQKVQLATALVNSPKLLLLDEPFSGLDPVNQGVLEDVIRDMAGRGCTVVFSTHVMQHAERLCDRLLLLARGRKVFEGTQDEAAASLPARLTLTSRADPSGLPGVAAASPLGPAEDGWTRYELALRRGAEPGALLESCTTGGFALRGFDIHRPALHEVFIHLVGADQEIVR